MTVFKGVYGGPEEGSKNEFYIGKAKELLSSNLFREDLEVGGATSRMVY
ncbi:MAG: hypothetical protein CM15mP12_8320 [Gammaproteobacteria bacterium]|nr:MAG: hypothetical protein CM15mP12_8320 [Gammaproteobacteria bacterium]